MRVIRFRYHPTTIIAAIMIACGFVANIPWFRIARQRNSSLRHCTNDDVLRWASENGAEFAKVTVGNFLFESAFEDEEHWLERIRVRRGLRAAKKIEPGEVILSIPRKLLISNETAYRSGLGEILRSDQSIDRYSALALFILQERAKGSTSFYYPYICTLPTSFDTPLYWEPERLASLSASVNATDLAFRARLLRSSLRRRYDRAAPVLARLGLPHDLRLFAWALTAVLSRNWGVVNPPPSAPFSAAASDSSVAADSSAAVAAAGEGIPPAYGRDAVVMAPVADMANHDSRGGSRVAWLDGGRRLGLVARRAYAPGDEVLTSYGPGCNARFLATYGFAPAAPRRDPPCAPAADA